MEKTISKQFYMQRLSPDDLGKVAAVHVAAFPGNALTQLGEEAVRRYYLWLFTGPHDVTPLGVFEGDTLAGFCIAGRFQGAMMGYLRKNRWYLIWRMITHFWTFGSPLFRQRAIAALDLFTKTRKKKNVQNQPVRQAHTKDRNFGIKSIAVDPHYQRHGVGRQLLVEAEKVAASQGFQMMDLAVDVDNEKAIRFYEALGWQRRTNRAEWEGYMIKQLNTSSSATNSSLPQRRKVSLGLPD